MILFMEVNGTVYSGFGDESCLFDGVDGILVVLRARREWNLELWRNE